MNLRRANKTISRGTKFRANKGQRVGAPAGKPWPDTFFYCHICMTNRGTACIEKSLSYPYCLHRFMFSFNMYHGWSSSSHRKVAGKFILSSVTLLSPYFFPSCYNLRNGSNLLNNVIDDKRTIIFNRWRNASHCMMKCAHHSLLSALAYRQKSLSRGSYDNARSYVCYIMFLDIEIP